MNGVKNNINEKLTEMPKNMQFPVAVTASFVDCHELITLAIYMHALSEEGYFLVILSSEVT